jgi:hypothetical protein
MFILNTIETVFDTTKDYQVIESGECGSGFDSCQSLTTAASFEFGKLEGRCEHIAMINTFNYDSKMDIRKNKESRYGSITE